MTVPLSILFVCTGNVCRSPYAERRSATISRVHRFASAGTGALVGHRMDAEMAAVARARGANPDGFSAKQVNLGLVQSADLILTMEKSQRSWLLSEWPATVARVFTLAQFTGSLPEEPAGLDARTVIDAVAAARPPADPAYDIPDPFRRGRRAALACSDRLDGQLLRLYAHLG